MITIQELLYNRGLSRSAAVKLVRHKQQNKDIYAMYKYQRDEFLKYQSTQHRPVFRDVEYIASFIGESGMDARFIGVYRITDSTLQNGMYHYTMEEQEGFEDIKERVIIRWENPISWHQWIANEMEVVQLSVGLHYTPIADYNEIVISFANLEHIVLNQYADWKMLLSAIKGVYLITDMNTGKLYVGSAYGEDGVWQRWREYVSTGGHGNNKFLKKLMQEDADYARKYFQFSLLMLLSKTVTAEEAINKEQLFKRKLGSNSFGLNCN